MRHVLGGGINMCNTQCFHRQILASFHFHGYQPQPVFISFNVDSYLAPYISWASTPTHCTHWCHIRWWLQEFYSPDKNSYKSHSIKGLTDCSLNRTFYFWFSLALLLIRDIIHTSLLLSPWKCTCFALFPFPHAVSSPLFRILPSSYGDLINHFHIRHNLHERREGEDVCMDQTTFVEVFRKILYSIIYILACALFLCLLVSSIRLMFLIKYKYKFNKICILLKYKLCT